MKTVHIGEFEIAEFLVKLEEFLKTNKNIKIEGTIVHTPSRVTILYSDIVKEKTMKK